MEDLETLNGSLSFESADLPHSKTSALKATLASPPKLPPSLFGKPRPNSLRRDYQQLKAKYLQSEHTKWSLQQGVAALSAVPCPKCPTLVQENTSTKRALEEALEVTKLLLQEMHTRPSTPSFLSKPLARLPQTSSAVHVRLRPTLHQQNSSAESVKLGPQVSVKVLSNVAHLVKQIKRQFPYSLILIAAGQHAPFKYLFDLQSELPISSQQMLRPSDFYILSNSSTLIERAGTAFYHPQSREFLHTQTLGAKPIQLNSHNLAFSRNKVLRRSPSAAQARRSTVDSGASQTLPRQIEFSVLCSNNSSVPLRIPLRLRAKTPGFTAKESAELHAAVRVLSQTSNYTCRGVCDWFRLPYSVLKGFDLCESQPMNWSTLVSIYTLLVIERGSYEDLLKYTLTALGVTCPSELRADTFAPILQWTARSRDKQGDIWHRLIHSMLRVQNSSATLDYNALSLAAKSVVSLLELRCVISKLVKYL